MAYLIVSTSNFTRGLRRLSGIDKDRAQRLIQELVLDPYSYKELTGKFREIRSARFGDHRIIYAIDETRKEIVLLALEPRSSIYKR